MLSDSTLVPQTIVRPKSFVGLMTLYESNYIRALAVIPELKKIECSAVSRVGEDFDLYFEVLERTRYTLIANLTYRFSDNVETISDPDMRIKVYFDCCLVEVLSVGESHRHQVLRDIAERHCSVIDRRWSRNIMLNKWLEYCLECGHRLEPE